MFKCKECGAEYEVKPDYCDCGNDEFETVGVSEKTIVKDNTPIQPLLSKEGVKSSASQINSQELPGNTVEKQPKIQPASAMNFNNSTQTSHIPARTLSIDLIPLIIFIICILLSLYVIFFAFNPTEKENNVEIKQETETPKNIPSIDKIWNNALPVVKKEEPKVEEKVENIIKQIVPIQTPKKTETSKKVQTTVQPKVTKVPLTKVTTTQKKTSATTKPVTTTSKQQTATTQEQAKKAADEAAKQKAEAERKAAEAAQLKKLQEEQAKKAAAEKARQTAAAKQEFTNYKAQLRNTIGRKIDFTRVIGDGSCTVAFKIDPNGKLINRSFAKQSSNNTLNDAVYAAVMATPTFNPPPSAYNNETLNLNIKFSNGNFEISLP